METHHAHAGHSALPGVKWLWKETWQVYTKYFPYFIAVTLPIVALTTFSDAFENMAKFAAPALSGQVMFTFVSVVSALCAFIVSALVPIALIKAANEARTGTPASMEELLAFSGKRFWGFLWVVIVTAFFNAIALGAFIIPMIVLNIYLGFAVTAYAVDGRKGVDALIWSAHAVAGKWWKVFGRTIILILTCFAASGLLFIILFPLQQILGMAAWKTLFNGLMVFLNNLFIVPFAAIYSVMLYTELKKTKHAPSDLDQYRIRRNLWTMVVVGVVCAIAITVTSLRFIVPVVIEKMTYWPMMH